MGRCHSQEKGSNSRVSPREVAACHGKSTCHQSDLPSTASNSEQEFIGFHENLNLLCLDQFVSRYTGEIMYRWRPATVMYFEKENGQIKIHFDGWKDKHDIWLNLKRDMNRFAFIEIMDDFQISKGEPLNEKQIAAMNEYSLTGYLPSPYPTSPTKPNKGMEMMKEKAYRIGQKIDIQDIYKVKNRDFIKYKWRPGEIIDINQQYITVHYIGWGDKWNEVIDTSIDGHRIKEGGSKIVPRGTSRDSVKREIIGKKPAVSSNAPKVTRRRRSLGEGSSHNLDALVNRELLRKRELADEGDLSHTSSAPKRGLSRTRSFPPFCNDNDSQNFELMKKLYQQQEDCYYAALQQEESFISALNAQRMHVVEVDGDGNCLFRAVAHQIWLDEDRHMELRKMCVKHMINNSKRFAAFFEGDFAQYLDAMSKPGTWGDDIEIRALEEITDRMIFIYSSYETTIEPLKTNFDDEALLGDGVKPIKISYHGKNHYNSIFDESISLPLEIRPSNTLCLSRHKRLMS